MYGTSVIRAPLHRLCTYVELEGMQGRPHAIFCADQRHPRAASGPHAIFCAEKSAHKKELRQHAVHL